MRYVNRKGQEEAPFALLLAAIMLAMVIPLAMHLLTKFQQSRCRQRVENNMAKMAREMELAATLGGGQRRIQINLAAQSCSGLEVGNFSIKSRSESKCLKVCNDPNCKLLVAEAAGEEGSVVLPPRCIRIPVNVEFTTECGLIPGDVGLEGVQLLPVGSEITPGTHTLLVRKEGYKVRMCEVVGETR